MRAISMLLTVFLVVGPTVLVCGCTGTQWGGDRNQTAAGSSQSGDMMRIDEILAQDGNHSTFIRALEVARLERLFTGPGPYTVFAPTDEAFSRLTPEMLDRLIEDPKGNLAEILLYHVLPCEYEISGSDTVVTVQGSLITVDEVGKTVIVNGAETIGTDILAKNGIIYAIDGVLIPPDIILPTTNESDDKADEYP